MEKITYLKCIDSLEDNILIFDINSIPDGMTIIDYLEFVEKTGTIPYSSSYEVFSSKFKGVMLAEKPYLLKLKDGEKIELKFIDKTTLEKQTND